MRLKLNAECEGQGVKSRIRHASAFTMVEIALSLAVIGFALVAIIGVLPVGLNVQKENREETVINFDANFLMDVLRSGAQGQDILTNYIVSITNVYTYFDARTNPIPTSSGVFAYTTTNVNLNGGVYSSPFLTSGQRIVGILTTPKFTDAGGGAFYSNYITADFRAINGGMVDQGLSSSSRDFAFTYRVYPEIIPAAVYSASMTNNTDPNASSSDQTYRGYYLAYAGNLQANLNDIRLRYRWPVLPGGQLGNGRQVFRSAAAGQIQAVSDPTNRIHAITVTLYSIAPQSYRSGTVLVP